MDPVAAFARFMDLLETDDTDDTAEAREVLSEIEHWLGSGGFVPELTREQMLQLLTLAHNDLSTQIIEKEG